MKPSNTICDINFERDLPKDEIEKAREDRAKYNVAKLGMQKASRLLDASEHLAPEDINFAKQKIVGYKSAMENIMEKSPWLFAKTIPDVEALTKLEQISFRDWTPEISRMYSGMGTAEDYTAFNESFASTHGMQLSRNDYAKWEQDFLDHYIKDSSPYNELLRTIGAEQKYAPKFKAIDKILEKQTLKSPTKVFRGMDVDASFLTNFSEGNQVKFANYVSTSLDESVAKSFAESGKFDNKVLMEINLPAGQNALYLDTLKTAESVEGAELEVLLPRNTVFNIDKIEYDEFGKIKRVYATPVSEELTTAAKVEEATTQVIPAIETTAEATVSKGETIIREEYGYVKNESGKLKKKEHQVEYQKLEAKMTEKRAYDGGTNWLYTREDGSHFVVSSTKVNGKTVYNLYESDKDFGFGNLLMEDTDKSSALEAIKLKRLTPEYEEYIAEKVAKTAVETATKEIEVLSVKADAFADLKKDTSGAWLKQGSVHGRTHFYTNGMEIHQNYDVLDKTHSFDIRYKGQILGEDMMRGSYLKDVETAIREGKFTGKFNAILDEHPDLFEEKMLEKKVKVIEKVEEVAGEDLIDMSAFGDEEEIKPIVAPDITTTTIEGEGDVIRTVVPSKVEDTRKLVPSFEAQPIKIKDPYDAPAILKKEHPNLTTSGMHLEMEERKAFREFSWDAKETNEFLKAQSNVAGTFKKTAASIRVDAMDSAIEKSELSKPLQVYRGGGVTNEYVEKYLKVGETQMSKQFLSTSLKEDVAEQFASLNQNDGDATVLFKYNLPKGQKSLFLGNDIAVFPAEQELLLPRNQEFVVTKIETEMRNKPHYIVTLEPKKHVEMVENVVSKVVKPETTMVVERKSIEGKVFDTTSKFHQTNKMGTEAILEKLDEKQMEEVLSYNQMSTQNGIRNLKYDPATAKTFEDAKQQHLDFLEKRVEFMKSDKFKNFLIENRRPLDEYDSETGDLSKLRTQFENKVKKFLSENGVEEIRISRGEKEEWWYRLRLALTENKNSNFKEEVEGVIEDFRKNTIGRWEPYIDSYRNMWKNVETLDSVAEKFAIQEDTKVFRGMSMDDFKLTYFTDKQQTDYLQELDDIYLHLKETDKNGLYYDLHEMRNEFEKLAFTDFTYLRNSYDMAGSKELERVIELQQNLHAEMVKTTFTDKGFMSTSYNDKLLQVKTNWPQFWKNNMKSVEDLVRVEIDVPKGTKGWAIDGQTMKAFEKGIKDFHPEQGIFTQNEFVIGRGAKFKVKSFETKASGKQRFVLKLEVVNE